MTSATALTIDTTRILMPLDGLSLSWHALPKSGIGARHRQAADQYAGAGGLGGGARYNGVGRSGLLSGAPLLNAAVATVDCEVEEPIEGQRLVLVTGSTVGRRAEAGSSHFGIDGYHELG